MPENPQDRKPVSTNLTMLEDMAEDDLRWLQELAAIRVKGVGKTKKRKRRKADYNQNQN